MTPTKLYSENEIPINFEYQGKQVTGKFSPVTGGGNPSLFHLSEQKNGKWYHCGKLFYTQHFGWRYGGNSYEDMVDYFEQFIVAWFQ